MRRGRHQHETVTIHTHIYLFNYVTVLSTMHLSQIRQKLFCGWSEVYLVSLNSQNAEMNHQTQ